ncbi:MAG: hypothetical protein IJD10_05630, partial [Clostridia bacterium]|nr:hypothetical protein [Clostridia bacterium]
SAVSEPWWENPSLGDRIEEVRQFVIDLASGKNPFEGTPFPEWEHHDAPHDTTAVKRNYRGKHILSVYSESPSPLYLREWVGGSYRGNSWYAPDVSLLGPSYGQNGTVDNPYRVTEAFLAAYKAFTGQKGEEIFGLRRGDVVIMPIATGTLMPLPVTTVSGIRSPGGGSFDTAYGVTSDYIYSSHDLSRITPYEAEALLRRMPATEEYRAFLETYYFYRLYVETGVMPAFGTDAYTMALRFERDRLRSAVELAEKGDRYAKTLYGEEIGNNAIDRIVSELFADTDIRKYYNVIYDADIPQDASGVITLTEEDGRKATYYLSSEAEVLHADEIGFLVATFLQKRCTYTLDPKKGSLQNAMEEFLYGNREGYCVQFATAATLMMRRLGFTARYAEGYIASSPSRSTGNAYELPYSAKVKDRDAHAWMEVWVSGYGWRTVEATPGYYGDFYYETETDPALTTPEETDMPPESTETAGGDSQTAPVTRPPETTTVLDTEPVSPPETGGVEPPFDDSANVLPAFLWGSGILLILLLAAWWIVSIRSRYDQRRERIARALAGCTEEERETLADALTADLTDALLAYRLLPEAGEGPTAFGRRADAFLAFPKKATPPSRAVAALSRRIYGGVTDGADLKVMASVTERLVTQAGRRLNPFRFFLYRCILRRI